jgi:ABC-type spermidine/putrescine transport system permease subunit I
MNATFHLFRLFFKSCLVGAITFLITHVCVFPFDLSFTRITGCYSSFWVGLIVFSVFLKARCRWGNKSLVALRQI